MKARNADPEFAAKRDARLRMALVRVHADPEFTEKHSARMRAQNADPEFAARGDAGTGAMHRIYFRRPRESPFDM